MRRERTYQLIKKQEDAHDAPCDDDDFNVNIFRETHQPPRPNDLEQAVERPVGGYELFRKMEQAGRDRLN